jgi:hypothetical protein
MKMPGYDTFGPQYPPEWDKPNLVECSSCLIEFDEDWATTDEEGNIICPDCEEVDE